MSVSQIIAAKDKSWAAGKRGFCKHLAALGYKLVEARLPEATERPKPVSCTKQCTPAVESTLDKTQH